MESEVFPCSCCGACCRRMGRMVGDLGPEVLKDKSSKFYFPYDWDETGRCEKLTDDNLCSVHDNLPDICNISKFLALMGVSIEEGYPMTIEACNRMMDEDDMPESYRIIVSNSYE